MPYLSFLLTVIFFVLFFASLNSIFNRKPNYLLFVLTGLAAIVPIHFVMFMG